MACSPRPTFFCSRDFASIARAMACPRRSEPGVFVPVPIGVRALDVLAVLVGRSGDLVTKEEMMAAVWGRKVFENVNLTVQISALRRILDGGRATGAASRPSPRAAIGLWRR